MEIRKTRYGMLFTLMFGLLLLLIHPVYAADELRLIGIVKSINHATKTVLVDVQTSRCHGIRKFTIADPAPLDDAVGKRIDFLIDSSFCVDGVVYKIETIAPRRK